MPSASEPALPWADLEEELRRTPPERWLRLGSDAGTNRLNQRRIVVGRFASAPELRRALAHADLPTADWRAEADRFVPGLPERATPCRRIPLAGPDLLLDLHAGAAPGERPVVVGLTGNWGLLMAPVGYVAEALQRLGFDLVVVRRRWKGGYLGGGRGDGDWARQIVDGLDTLFGRRLRPRVLLGTSAGGVAALALAERLGAPQALAISATAQAGLFEAGGGVRRLRRWHRWGPGPAMRLVHAAEHGPDREAAALIARRYRALRLPPARLEVRAVADGGGHNPVHALVERGRPLPELLADWLAPD